MKNYTFKEEKPKNESIESKKSNETNNINDQLNELKNELKKEKNNNRKLKDDIFRLNNIIENLEEDKENITDKYEISIKKLKNDIKKLKSEITELKNVLNDKIKEIQEYNFKLNNLQENKEKKNIIKQEEKIISVSFMTQGNQDITHHSMICKNSDLFIKLEERLYNDFPKYKNIETFFLVNTRRILRFQTLEENKIKNGDIISLFIIE